MSFQRNFYVPLPEPITPPLEDDSGVVCVQIDKKWLPYLIAVTKTLCVERTWETQAERASKQAQSLLVQFMLAEQCGSGIDLGGSEIEDMTCCIRMRDGVLQVLACGEWVTVDGWDASQVVGVGTHPPDDGGPIPFGSCKEYNLSLPAGLQVPLPVPVRTGDSVLIDTWRGQWSDGSGAGIVQPYFCADGGEYLLGACTGLTFTAGGDPLPSANHMSIIMEVGGIGVFMAPMGSERFIPGGVSDEPVVFQANDATLGDNLGGVNFHVKVCRPQQEPIGLSYTTGSGPASVADGGIVTLTAALFGGVTFRINVALTECCKCEVVANPGWVSGGSTSSPAYDDCTGTTINHTGPDVAPTDFLANVNAQHLYANGDANWQMQVRITRL